MRDRLEAISGKLLFDKLIVWLIGVQASNDVVAIVPRLITQLVILETITLTKPDDIEPVAPPMLAELR